MVKFLSSLIPQMKPRLSVDERLWRLALGALVVVATVTTFLPALDNGFVDWDDGLYIFRNPWIRSLNGANLRWMLSATRGSLWQPLTWLSLAVDYRLWGPDPWGFHFSNIILHALTALAFCLVCLELFAFSEKPPPDRALAAAFAALFFAVHPLRVESVAWAVERKDVLSGLFWMLAVLFYLMSAKTPRGSSSMLLAAAVAFALSLAVKVTGAILPPVLLLLEIYPLRRLSPDPGRWAGREGRAALKRLAPFFALAFLCGTAGLRVAKAQGVMPGFEMRGLVARAAQVVYAPLFYLWKTVWPTDLSPFYPQPRWWSGPLSLELAALFAAFFAVAAVFYGLRRRRPGAAVSFAAFLVVLLPMLGFVQHGMAYSVCDRYSYLSCAGFAALFGAFFAGRGFAGKAVACAWLAALGVMAWRQCAVWRDTPTLWRAAVDRAPGGFVISNLGMAFVDEGRFDEGLPLLKRAAAEYPEMPLNFANLGVGLYRAGDVAGARAAWRRGFEVYGISDLHAHLGSVQAAGDGTELADAIAHLKRAVELTPAMAPWRLSLADGLARAGRYEEAEREFAAALAIDPELGRAENNWGLALAARGRRDEAAAHYRAALRLPGARAEANYNLGNVLLDQGRSVEAERHYLESLRLDPGLARASVNLGNILARRGRLAEAERRYLDALKKDPGLKEAGVNLAAVRRALRR